MALLAQLTDLRLSEPDGSEIIAYVSFIDDTIVDPKLRIVASARIPLAPDTRLQGLKAAVLTQGKQIIAALAARDAVLAQIPVGTKLDVATGQVVP